MDAAEELRVKYQGALLKHLIDMTELDSNSPGHTRVFEIEHNGAVYWVTVLREGD